MKTKHTPGPWEAQEFAVMDAAKTKGIGIYCGDDCITDLVFGQGWSDDQVKANARLIAAAPELLQLLTDARRFMLDDDIESCRGVLVGDVCSRVLERVGDD